MTKVEPLFFLLKHYVGEKQEYSKREKFYTAFGIKL